MTIINQVQNVINSMLTVLEELVEGNTNSQQYMAILLAAFCFSLGLDIVIALLGKDKTYIFMKEE